MRDLAVDRQHDNRPMERVHQLRRDDSDDSAVPPLGGQDEHRSGTDIGIGLDDLPGRRENRGFFLLPADVFAIEQQRQRACFLAHRLVAREQQPRRDIGRAHAAGRVDPWGQHERDVVAVDRLARQT